MKKIKKISVVFFSLIVLANSCASQNDKIKSYNNVQLAEQIIKENISHIETDSSKSAFLKALKYLNKAIELDSLNKQAYQNKVTVLKELGRVTDVILTLSKLLTIDPEYAEGYIVLGFNYEKLQKFDLAKMAYENAKSIFLKKFSSDLRNSNLIFIEYLITKDTNEAFGKLKSFPIKNLELEESVRLQIHELEKE